MATFALISLNCFGVPTPTNRTRCRLLTLARELDRRDAMVVCLQEVQTHFYRRLLIQACSCYPANVYAPFVHAPKGGLLTLARLPLRRSTFTLFRERGLWHTPAVTDWLLHKGILQAHLMFDGLPIAVFNTHLTANYSGNWSAENRYARTEREQLRQLAGLVAAQPPDTLVLVAGDFNIPRGSWLYDEFMAASGLTDPLAGDTRPTLRVPLGVPARYALPIDFALFRAPDLPGLQVSSNLCFREKLALIDGRQGYLSDHYGIELRLTWDDRASRHPSSAGHASTPTPEGPRRSAP
jgi:endonuclease/exonuclease/phosphatase family metal-dependent hydrolase